jgi:2-oxoglutarate ferredoxin oxidoreductase subunit delta
VTGSHGKKTVTLFDRLRIDQDRCKGCALCTAACPRGLLVVSDQPNRHGYQTAEIGSDELAHCSSCALCAQVCPDLAITVFRPLPNKGGG